MNILAIDTATDVLSVALSAPDGTRLAEINAGTRHSELLMETIDSLFKSAGLERTALELAACMKGPGSFTGLRIGYAAAKGISFALGIPLAAVPTLDCIARPFSERPGIALPVIDAKKSSFFASFYRRGVRLSPYLDLGPDELAAKLKELRAGPEEKIILSGPGAEKLFPFLSAEFPCTALDPSFKKGRALDILDIIDQNSILYKEGEYSGPLYLRKSDAELTVNV